MPECGLCVRAETVGQSAMWICSPLIVGVALPPDSALGVTQGFGCRAGHLDGVIEQLEEEGRARRGRVGQIIVTAFGGDNSEGGDRTGHSALMRTLTASGSVCPPVTRRARSGPSRRSIMTSMSVSY